MAESDSDSLSFVECVYQMETGIAQSADINEDQQHGRNASTMCDHNADGENMFRLQSMLTAGDFEALMVSDVSKQILSQKASDENCSISDRIRENLASRMEGCHNPEEEIERHFAVLCVGIASLQLFVQNNWTGPPTSQEVKQQLSERIQVQSETLSNIARDALCPEGNTIYQLVSMPELLLIARSILVDCDKFTSHCKTAGLWKLRCLWVQQQLLDERSPELYNIIMPLIKTIEEDEMLMNAEKGVSLSLKFHLECSHIYAFYYEYKLASESLARATKLAGLEVDLTGALGKRTRFQQDDKAQLLLKVRRIEEEDGNKTRPSETSPIEGLPKDLLLDDETVLNSIKFKEEAVGDVPSLSGLEQALLLGLCVEHKRTRPKDILVVEELQAYVVSILRQPQSWSVQTLALRIRCQLEKDKGRTVERAMTQMQVLVDQFSSNSCPVKDRLKLFYAVNLPPRWTLEGELADLLMSLGCVTQALEIFIRLQLWEKMVGCYRLLQHPEKAIHVIQEQLEIKESALMWCLLGDVTREKKYYEKAWEVSGQRSSRAMSSLGLLYLHDKEFDKAIECLEISVEKNFLQYDAWFNLGYSAFESEKYEIAAKAYKRCLQLDSEDAQSWNNLATANIRLNDKPKAFKTLKEAIKCNYNNWKIWDNYLGVCIDLGEFQGGVQAYDHLLGLSPKHADEPVLQVLVRAVTENLKDNQGNPVTVLRPKILDLFEKITTEVTNNASVWSLYGILLGSCTSENTIENDKALQCLQRSHRLVTQEQRWHSEVATVQEVIQETRTLVEAYENCSKTKSSGAQAIQLLSSAKLMLKSIISKIKQEHYDAVTPPASWAELSESVQELETKLQQLVDRIAQLRGG